MNLNLYILIILLSFGFAQNAVTRTHLPLTEEEIVNNLLEKLSNAKEDTNRVNLIKTIVLELQRSDPDKAIEYGLEGLEITKKMGWEKGIAECYN
ncbi:MAG: hypothetical protein WC121_14445 [Candidatus Kapaibacterium sp.]